MLINKINSTKLSRCFIFDTLKCLKLFCSGMVIVALLSDVALRPLVIFSCVLKYGTLKGTFLKEVNMKKKLLLNKLQKPFET